MVQKLKRPLLKPKPLEEEKKKLDVSKIVSPLGEVIPKPPKEVPEGKLDISKIVSPLGQVLPREGLISELPSIAEHPPPVELMGGEMAEVPFITREETYIKYLEAHLTDTMPTSERIRIEQEIDELKELRKIQEAREVVGEIFPEMELAEFFEYYFPAFPEELGVTPEAQQFVQEERFVEFLSEIQSAGRTPETEALLRSIPWVTPITDAQIAQIFTPPEIAELEGEEPLPIAPMPDTWEGSLEVWVEEQIGRQLTFGEILGSRPIPELGNKKWTMALANSIRTGANLPRDIPYVGILDTAKVFAESLTHLPRQIAVAFLQAIQGEGGASVVNKDWADEFIEEASEDFDKFVQDVARRFPDSKHMIDFASTAQNISFSIMAMGAGLIAGVPTALIPLPGARVAAYTLGTAASGLVAYQMTTYQIVQQYLELANEDKIARTGVGLTLEEENKLKEEFSTKATQYGLWEAVPEAISNLAFVKLLLPLKGIVGKFAPALVRRIAGIYGTELITETVTQKGQVGIEVAVGLRDRNISWAEAFKEVAPQTFILTTIMAGAGTTVISVRNAIQKVKDSLKSEIGEKNIMYPELEQVIETQLREAISPAVEALPVVEVVEAPEATELRDLHTDPTRMAGLRNSTREEATAYINRLKKLAEAEGTRADVVKINQSIREVQEGDLGTAGVLADEVLTNIHKRYRVVHPEFELARLDEVALELTREAELEGLRDYLEIDPVATERFTLAGKQVKLESFISIREQTFPEYFTVKQAKALFPEHSFAEYNQKGTPKYNRVPRDVALDDLTKKFNMTPDAIADRVMRIRADRKEVSGLRDVGLVKERPDVPVQTVREVAGYEVMTDEEGNIVICG